MIKIIDDWYCTVSGSPICYTVKRGKGIVDKNGRCKDKEYGYYTSLQNAIKCVRDENMRGDVCEWSPPTFRRNPHYCRDRG